MKRVFLALMMVALAGMASGATTAQMTICATGAGCVTVLDNGSGDLDPGSGSMIFSGILGAWTTNVQVGSSAGPGLSSIDLGSTAKAGAASTLTVTFSDINFASTASSFNLDYSGATPVGGTATGKGWVDNTNTIFGTTTLVGSLGPFTGSFSQNTTAGVPGTPLYSLTEQVILTASGKQTTFFSTDLALNGSVPEPASVALLGGVLLFTARAIRRKTRRA